MIFNFGAKKMMGLDIGSRSLKGLCLKKSTKGVIIDDLIYHDYMTSNPQFPLNTDIESRLTAIITAHRLHKHGVAAEISDKNVKVIELSLPPIPKKEVRMAITNELEQQLDLSSDQLCFDYIFSESIKNKDREEHKYQVYVADEQETLSRYQLLDRCHLRPKSIEPAIIAITEMLKFNDYIEDDNGYIVVDLGESHIGVSLLSGTRILLNSNVPKGMGAINRILFDKLHMSYDKAESFKHTYDFDDLEGAPTPELGSIDDVFYEIFYKLQRYFDFLKVQLKDREIRRIYLTGGGSQIKHIDKAFQQFSEIETVIANPFRKIQIFSNKKVDEKTAINISPYMATAVGLALREIS